MKPRIAQDGLSERQLLVNRKKFGMLLRGSRKSKGFTLHSLDAKSGVEHQYIWKFESARRGCGPESATRLADGLELLGGRRREFLAAAAMTMAYPATNLEATGLEHELMHALVAYLHSQGILGRDIVNVKAGIAADEKTDKPDLMVTLDNGQVILVDFMTRRSPQGGSDSKPNNPNPNS